jgi:DNA-binding CsgD family transcriptional regulator
MDMGSDESCHAFLRQFESLVPIIARTLQRACPRPAITKRENAVLEQRMSGKIPKEIAVVEAISESTVRQHLQTIKKKLFTNDLVNAVVIALRSGMLVQDRKEALENKRSSSLKITTKDKEESLNSRNRPRRQWVFR